MPDKRLVNYLKRVLCGAAAVSVTLAALYNICADELRLQRQLDNDYEAIMLAPLNDVNAPHVVNINTASANRLQRIEGIGTARAEAIVAYREQHGGFSSVDELVNVSGIGSGTLEKIRGELAV